MIDIEFLAVNASHRRVHSVEMGGHVVLNHPDSRSLHPGALEGKEFQHGRIHGRSIWAEAMLCITRVGCFEVVHGLMANEKFETCVELRCNFTNNP